MKKSGGWFTAAFFYEIIVYVASLGLERISET